MNKAKFVIFALLTVFIAATIFSCNVNGDDPFDVFNSSSSVAISGTGVCAGQEYDMAFFRCESGEIVGKCKGVDYYPAYQTCENGNIKDGSSISSSSGTVDNTPQMCGGVSYDPTVYRCETGELIGKCMGKDYYVDFQVCNNGVIESKNKSSSSVNNSSSSTVTNSSSSSYYGNMCGSIGYDPNIFRCESGELIGRCRGVDYYPAYQVCNNGEVETKNDCKGVEFVPSEQFCSAQDSTVYNRCNGSTYNTNTQDCCGNKTVFILGNNQCQDGVLLLKCGTFFYNDSTEFCSGNKVYAKCNDSTYNVSTHGCKDDVIVPKCGDEFYDKSTQFCSAQDTLVYNKCDGVTFNTYTHGCENNVLKVKCGNELYTSSTQFCSAEENKVYNRCGTAIFNTLTQGCCGTTIYSFVAQKCENGVTVSKITTGTFTDSRDGKSYRLTEIGTQIWMAENLNYEADGSRCYSDIPANCDTFGRLYNWEAAKTSCPTGWHLPTNTEWTTLENYVGGVSVAGKQLRASGADEYKFSALLGGAFAASFTHLNTFGYFWTATTDGGSIYNHAISKSSDNVQVLNGLASRLFSVRCVKD